MDPEISKAFFPRRQFVYEAERLGNLTKDSEYFQMHTPMYDSPYREVYERLEAIRRTYGPGHGEICAMEALLYATDVDFGIRVLEDAPHFAMSRDKIRASLLDRKEVEGNCELRLIEVARVLQDHCDRVKDALKQPRGTWTCGDGANPVATIIKTLLQGG
jgi:hypothetical protein